MKYILEPLLFAFDPKASEDELTEYLYELLNLDDWWEEHKDEIYVMSNMGQTLLENNYYPYVESLKPMLDGYGIDFISYKDVSKLLDKYLRKSHFIDKDCEDVMIGNTGQKFSQPIKSDISKRPKEMHEEFLKLLWFVFCLRLIKNDEDETYVVIAKDISESLKVEFKYETFEDVNGKPGIVPHKKNAEISCKSSLSDYLKDAKTPFLIWKYSESKNDIDLGLSIAVLQAENMTCLQDAYTNSKFVIQNSFYEDYCDNHYSERPKDIVSAIDSMVKVIEDIRHGDEHNMRTGPGGNNPYVFHGEYAGMRKNVTTSIKLHYWKNKPSYRFAKIGEHDFYDLPWED